MKKQDTNSVLSLEIEYLKREIEEEKMNNKKISQKLSEFFNLEKINENKMEQVKQNLEKLKNEIS